VITIHSIPSAMLMLLVLASVHNARGADSAAATTPARTDAVVLPKPNLEGRVTLEKTLNQRRSVREYAPGAITLAELSQLAWAAQGITSTDGKRTTPSARAVYPLTVYFVANDVTGLAAGVYRYVPKDHSLARVATGDHVAAMSAATPRQEFIAHAPIIVVVAGDSALAAEKFGRRAERWTAMETGFVVQDIYLESTALGLGTVMVGSFDDVAIRGAIGLVAGQVPYAVMPVGRKK
jgi:SagB-type dehydrogenase family enzyme